MEIGLHGDKGQSKRVLKSLPSGKDSSPPQGAHTPMTQFPRSTETKRISHPRGLWAILGKGNGARQPSWRPMELVQPQCHPATPRQLSSGRLQIPPLLQVPACPLDTRGIFHYPCHGSQTLKHQRTKPHKESLEWIISSLGGAQTDATHPLKPGGTHACDGVSNTPSWLRASARVRPIPRSAKSSCSMFFLLQPSALLSPPLVPCPFTCPGPLHYHGDSVGIRIFGTNASAVSDYLEVVRQGLWSSESPFTHL